MNKSEIIKNDYEYNKLREFNQDEIQEDNKSYEDVIIEDLIDNAQDEEGLENKIGVRTNN